MSEEDKTESQEIEEETEEETEVEEPSKDPEKIFGQRQLLEQRIVHVSCRARADCEGDSALMTEDPRDRKWVRYRCSECNGSWTISKGGSFSM